MKHTKGPWKVERHEFLEIWNQNTHIAIINEIHEGVQDGYMNQSNAQLIAAAPEMFEFIKKFKDEYIRNYSRTEWHENYSSIQFLIDKVRGETNE